MSSAVLEKYRAEIRNLAMRYGARDVRVFGSFARGESHWQDAVIRQLEIIGEAVKRISPEILGHRPDIPWRRIAGM